MYSLKPHRINLSELSNKEDGFSCRHAQATDWPCQHRFNGDQTMIHHLQIFSALRPVKGPTPCGPSEKLRKYFLNNGEDLRDALYARGL